jgi:hypothetical protein
MLLEIYYIFEEVSEGSHLTVIMYAQSAGYFRVIGSVFGIAVKQQIGNDLKTQRLTRNSGGLRRWPG